MAHCKNCDTQVERDFCPQCGQKDIELERPLSELLGEVLHETFDVDGRAFRTLRDLFLHPGVLTNEFLAGRRQLYTPPFRLYLVTSVVFFVVTAWVAGQGILLNEGQTLESDAQGQARFVSDALPRLMFVMLPVFALLLKAAYRHRLYFDHLIYSLHLHSAAYVVLAFMLPLEQDDLLLALPQLALFGYLLASFVISMHRVYGASWLVTCIKAIIMFFVYMSLISGASEAVGHFTMPGSTALPSLTD